MTVISTLQPLTLLGASKTQGYALRVGEERKRAAHNEACSSVGVIFIPLVVESLGGWSEKAYETIARIGHLLGQRMGSPPRDSTRHLFQRLSIILWRGNANQWLHLPTLSPWIAFLPGLMVITNFSPPPPPPHPANNAFTQLLHSCHAHIMIRILRANYCRHRKKICHHKHQNTHILWCVVSQINTKQVFA